MIMIMIIIITVIMVKALLNLVQNTLLLVVTPDNDKELLLWNG